MGLLKLILIVIAMLAIGGLGMAVKIWGKKGGEFNGTCASNSPFLNKEGEPCQFCGATADEKCKSDEVRS